MHLKHHIEKLKLRFLPSLPHQESISSHVLQLNKCYHLPLRCSKQNNLGIFISTSLTSSHLPLKSKSSTNPIDSSPKHNPNPSTFLHVHNYHPNSELLPYPPGWSPSSTLILHDPFSERLIESLS